MKKHLFAVGLLCAPLSTFAEECPSPESLFHTQESGQTFMLIPDDYKMSVVPLFSFDSENIKSAKLRYVLFNPKMTQKSDFKDRYVNVKTNSEISCNYTIDGADDSEPSFVLTRNGSQNAFYDLGKDWHLHSHGWKESTYYCFPTSSANVKRDCRFSKSSVPQ